MGFFDKAESLFNATTFRELYMKQLRFSHTMPVSFAKKSKRRDAAMQLIRWFYFFWVFLSFCSVFVRANKLLGYTDYPIQHKILDFNWLNRLIDDVLFRLHYFWNCFKVELLLKEVLILENLAKENGKLSPYNS